MKITRFHKLAVLINCTVPVALLGWDALHNDLGANPAKFAILTTGLLALIFLLLSLSVTPIARITGWNWLVHFRRLLGLYAFFHAGLHFLIYFVYDRALSISSTVSEIFKIPYLIFGLLSLLLMTPLAVTSADGVIRKMGTKRWKKLHRLAYIAAIAACVHYYMLVKADIRQPLAFAIVLGVLLGYRIVASVIRRRSAAEKLQHSAIARPHFWKGQLRVAQVIDETPNVRTFRLAPVSGDQLPFDYLPGQYLNLSLEVEGKKVNRSYTIASTPTRSGYCEITVKREELGISSSHLHGRIKPGDFLNISAPAGKFTFTGDSADSIVLIAGGVGITPLMSKLRYLTDCAWPGEIYFMYSARTRADLIFREELEMRGRKHPNLHIALTLTREAARSENEFNGRITAEYLSAIIPNFASRLVHICGPDEMAREIKAIARSLGVLEARIAIESFTSPKRESATSAEVAFSNEPAASLATNGEPWVIFTRSGRSAPISPDQTVLEAAEELGVPISFDCRSGICGQCRSKVISGRVTMEVDEALGVKDRSEGYILACQARCVDQVAIDA